MTRDDLPLADYDHLPVGSLTHRVRSLDADALRVLLAYERDHANRPAVIGLLENRLSAVEEGAPRSDGSAHGEMPETAPAPATGGPVSPATTGPQLNPPAHGDPTNPRQPR